MEVEESEGVLTGRLEGEDVGLFIGRHGQTIDAVQHLAQRIVFPEGPSSVRVVIDANGYRERRAELLRADADDAADEALRDGQPVELDPLPPSERRIVHEYLRERGDVRPTARATSRERFLVVSPPSGLSALPVSCENGCACEGLGAPCGLGGRAYRASWARCWARSQRDEHAPTAVRDRERGTGRACRRLPGCPGAGRRRGTHGLADLGTGAGLPGLALAIALPAATVSLIESQRRKCEFLEGLCAQRSRQRPRRVRARRGVGGGIERQRPRDCPRARRRRRWCSSTPRRLLRMGGALVDWRGSPPEEEERARGGGAAAGLALVEIRRSQPFAGRGSPSARVREGRPRPRRGFPRRAGIARKRPLGG